VTVGLLVEGMHDTAGSATSDELAARRDALLTAVIAATAR
jgi:hypothetical protein